MFKVPKDGAISGRKGPGKKASGSEADNDSSLDEGHLSKKAGNQPERERSIKHRKEIIKETVTVMDDSNTAVSKQKDLPYFKSLGDAKKHPVISKLILSGGMRIDKFGAVKGCCHRNLDDTIGRDKHAPTCVICQDLLANIFICLEARMFTF